MIRKLLSAVVALWIIAGPAVAQNYTATPGLGLTFGAKLVSGVLYPQNTICDPTTPSQCVGVNASGQMTALLGAGTNVVGKFSIDQTTPGTTNAVAQSGLWTVQPGNTPNTTPWLFSISQGGNLANVSIDGALAVNTPANPEFSDFFSGALDTTTNWTTNNSGGTTATSAGSLVVSGTTTPSQFAGLSTKQSWAPSGGSAQLFGVSVSFNTLVVTNSVRIFGIYTSPGTPTLAAPITDGYVFRFDATGTLFAEVWAAGTAISSTNLSAVSGCAPTAGVPNPYYFTFRTNLVQFGCGANSAAATVFVNPANQTLPVSVYSIAGTSAPGSAATMSLTGLILSTFTPGGVKSAGQAATINDPATVTTPSPNGVQVVSPGTIAGGAPFVKGTTVAMTGTTSTQILAAVSGKVLYVTRVKCNNSSATGTSVQIQDGSGGTVLDTLAAAATFGGEQGTGPTPLFWTTAGNGLFAQDVTTGASVICTASGYSG
jgi:hypothetical protein